MATRQAYGQEIAGLLNKHHDIRAYLAFHQILAHLICPLRCSCKPPCGCGKKRRQIVRSLNIEVYRQALKDQRNPAELAIIKFCLQIPEYTDLIEDYENAYPLWLIRQELQKRTADKQFRCVDALVDILLRLGETHESLHNERFASFEVALKILLGSIYISLLILSNLSPSVLETLCFP